MHVESMGGEPEEALINGEISPQAMAERRSIEDGAKMTRADEEDGILMASSSPNVSGLAFDRTQLLHTLGDLTADMTAVRETSQVFGQHKDDYVCTPKPRQTFAYPVWPPRADMTPSKQHILHRVASSRPRQGSAGGSRDGGGPRRGAGGAPGGGGLAAGGDNNTFYSNIDSMPDIRPRRKSIPLVSELVSGNSFGLGRWWVPEGD
ncbi:protein unc-13A-like [Tropilaelaps mercedesae]|uniref:Protein unc-13A-like n=1 Tax=Tropilaelaps mercedesae TaxID=418985 RepID=A0A1V9XVA5_9ACAR|nr:protein unc-13A-like [Tropilaelaps mercedesae]